jgi:hypothetical protein
MKLASGAEVVGATLIDIAGTVHLIGTINAGDETLPNLPLDEKLSVDDKLELAAGMERKWAAYHAKLIAEEEA